MFLLTSWAGILTNNCRVLFFIFSGSPVNTFEFIQPLLRSLDYELPKKSLAVDNALVIGRICWGVYTILYPWLNRWWLPQPFILPPEVHKVGPFILAEYLEIYMHLSVCMLEINRPWMCGVRINWATIMIFKCYIMYFRICSLTGWGDPLFLLSQSQRGDRLCSHGVLSRGNGFNHILLAREEK